MKNQKLPPPLSHSNTVKARADEIIRNQGLLDRIRLIVIFYHVVVSQSYMFAKYVFTRIFSDTDTPAELLRDLRSDPTILFNEFFFYRIISTFAGIREATEEQTPAKQYIIQTINLYLADYLELSGFEIAPSSYLFTTRIYEARKMLTAYSNIISHNFSSVYNRIINIHINRQKKYNNIVQRLRLELENSVTDEEFKQRVKDTVKIEITNTIRIVKDLLAHRQPNRQVFPVIFENVYEETEFIRQCYPLNYVFKNNNIHDDCVANPWNHFEAYFRMNQHLESLELCHHSCFPLRTAFSPRYLAFDTQNLIEICGHGAKIELVKENLNRFFAKIFNIRHHAFSEGRPQQQENVPEYSFHTDGYGLTVSIYNRKRDDNSNEDAMEPSHQPVCSSKVKAPKNLSYIHEMTPEQLKSLGPNIIFCDPGERDLLFMMHIDSLPKDKLTLRYTKCTSRILTNKKYNAEQKRKDALVSNLNDTITDPAVKETQPQTLINTLSKSKHNTTSPEVYMSYIQAKKECSRLYNFFSEYRDPDADENNDFAPLYREVRFKSATGKKLEASHIRNEIKAKFDHLEPIVIIIGDWSANHENTHYKVPQQGKLLRKLLAEEFTVHLVDEYNTSKICPICDSEAEPFLPIMDPRLEQQLQGNVPPRIEPHTIADLSLIPLEEGQIRSDRLLRCLGSNCKVMINNELRTRIYNRNLMAVLYFRRIFTALRDGQPLPARLTNPFQLKNK